MSVLFLRLLDKKDTVTTDEKYNEVKAREGAKCGDTTKGTNPRVHNSVPVFAR